MRRIATVLALSALALSTVAADTAAYEASEATYYLSNTGSGCGADASYQLLTSPRTGGPNCGYVGGAPFSEVFATTGDTEFGTNVYAAEAGASFVLDAQRAVTGQITILHGSGLVGAGQITVDLVLKARLVDTNKTVTLATGTAGDVIVGVGRSTFEFELDLDDTYDVTNLKDISLATNVRGVHANSGYTSSQGDSSFVLPTLLEVVPEGTTEVEPTPEPTPAP